MKDKRILFVFAIALGLLGARHVVCTPCAAEARLLETQLAQIGHPAIPVR